MTEEEAKQEVIAYLAERGSGYPTDNLRAERFKIGWTVFAWSDPGDSSNTGGYGQSIFLIGDNGVIEESSSSLPPGVPEAEFIAKHGGGVND